jgi:hypothetical protein
MDNEIEQIAKQIYIQLGGPGFSGMIGMVSPILVRDDRKKAEITAIFRWKAKALGGLNFMEVVLVLASDTYRVTFGRIHGGTVTRQKPIEDVYCEDLNPLFEQTTGLATIPPVVIMNSMPPQDSKGKEGEAPNPPKEAS